MKREDHRTLVEDGELPPDCLRTMRTALPVEAPEAVATRRERLVPALQSQIIAASAARHRAQRLRRAAGFGALAASVALFVAAGIALSGHVTTTDGPAASRPSGATQSGVSQGAKEASGHAREQAAPVGQAARLVQASAATLRVGDSTTEQALDASTSVGLALTPGMDLRTLVAGWLELELPSRARIEMSESSELALESLTARSQKLSLARGRIDVSVPKPQAGAAQRLSIVTPDSEVEVRGTVFSVEVRPSKLTPARLVTEVFVSRGSVSVRHAGQERLVTMGGHFLSDEGNGPSEGGNGLSEHGDGTNVAPTLESAPTAHGTSALAMDEGSEVPALRAPEPRTSTDGSSSKATLDERRPASRAPTSREQVADPSGSDSNAASSGMRASTLGEQNRLFERAIAARDGGDLAGAIALFDQLLTRYPSSPLNSSARIERARVISKRAGASSNDR